MSGSRGKPFSVRPKAFQGQELEHGATPPGGALGPLALRLARVHQRRQLARIGFDWPDPLEGMAPWSRYDLVDAMLEVLRALTPDDLALIAAEAGQ